MKKTIEEVMETKTDYGILKIVGQKGSVNLPEPWRELLGINEGDFVEITFEGDKMVVTKVDVS